MSTNNNFLETMKFVFIISLWVKYFNSELWKTSNKGNLTAM